MSQLKVTKMHGAGNDFVLIDGRGIAEERLPEIALRLCDRHFGVGADGMLVISDSSSADIKMRIFNSDGSEAQMCGNGIRCVGKYIHDNQLNASLCPTVETLAGNKTLTLHLGDSGLVETVTVDMGEAVSLSDSSVTLSTDSGVFKVIPVSIGNPHGVVEVIDAEAFEVAKIGPQLENHPYWPNKANIEFVTAEAPDTLCQRTWERGVGETLACGTGACAAAFAMASTGKVNWPVKVVLPGGTLVIDKKDEHLLMTGPASFVFETTVSV